MNAQFLPHTGNWQEPIFEFPPCTPTSCQPHQCLRYKTWQIQKEIKNQSWQIQSWQIQNEIKYKIDKYKKVKYKVDKNKKN